ncbi:MAG TPA: hypothetical protein PK530_10390 [Anaerolineales bacterium]|nr:hypothetical protein [Anaerolineales bacterium]
MNFVENIRNSIPGGTKNNLSTEEVARLETALQGALISVTPRREFVERLNRQLIASAPLTRQQTAPVVLANNKSRETILLGAATLLGAAAIFATGFRIGITILGTVGMLAQWMNRKQADKTPATQVAN